MEIVRQESFIIAATITLKMFVPRCLYLADGVHARSQPDRLADTAAVLQQLDCLTSRCVL